MKVLYVEDNEDNIYVLENRLKRLGHTVLIARDGAAGVQLATSELPDLILMDLSLPVLDGWEATRQLKAAAATRHIPVIAITANAMAGDREKALAAGCRLPAATNLTPSRWNCPACSKRYAACCRKAARRETGRCHAARGRRQ